VVEVFDVTPDWLPVSGGFEVVLGVVVAAPLVPAVPVVLLGLFTSVEVELAGGFVLVPVVDCVPGVLVVVDCVPIVLLGDAVL
jgi:hypothetical protein